MLVANHFGFTKQLLMIAAKAKIKYNLRDTFSSELREQDGSLISALTPRLAINGGNQLELGQEDTYNYTDNFWYHLE